MFCRQCGCEISNEAKFCNFCGTKTVAPKARKGESDNSLDANMPADGKNEIEANKKPAASSSDCAEANYESGSAIEEEKISEKAHPDCNTSKQTAEETANAPEASNLKAAVAQNKKTLSSSYADDPACRHGAGFGNLRGLRCVPRIQRRLAALSGRTSNAHHIK